MSVASRQAARWVEAFAVLFIAAALLLPFVGPFALSLARVRAHQEPDWSILVQLRLSRTLLGLLAGGALALAGTLFQAVLRDALATPYTLGISAGASLGAVISIWLGWQQIAGLPAVWVTAFAGSAVVLALVVGAALQQRRLSSFSLLLSGLAANSVCSAFIIVIYGLVGASKSFSISRWLIGSLDAIDYADARRLRRRGGDLGGHRHSAGQVVEPDGGRSVVGRTRGADVTRLTLSGYTAGSVLTAVTVALTGPIGFVGLVVPHLVRTRIGADHRVLMPCAFLGGGILLAACDAIGRGSSWRPPKCRPVRLWRFIGGPYLVWVLRQRSIA